jgi:hypothetical protein
MQRYKAGSTLREIFRLLLVGDLVKLFLFFSAIFLSLSCAPASCASSSRRRKARAGRKRLALRRRKEEALSPVFTF